MRKLTVKNFSVIKEAELEFGKITVLIGPQSSGKSLLCKLAYFLGNRVIEEALSAILNEHVHGEEAFSDFKASITRSFLESFPIETWQHKESSVILEANSYLVKVAPAKHFGDLEIVFSAEFMRSFYTVDDLVRRLPGNTSDSRRYLADQVRAYLNLLLAEPSLEEIFISRPIYIPDGRAFLANQSLGINLVSNPDIDPILKEFALEVSWGTARSPDPVLGEEGVSVLHDIRREIVRISGGGVEGRNGSARFRRLSDGKSIPLPLLSSGTQSILPMFNVLWRVITEQRSRILFPRPDNLPAMPNKIIVSAALVYLEEPESNIFPSTQYDLIRLLAWLSNEWRLRFSWVITTHSPYTLSSFNNLIYAGQLSKHKQLRKKIPIDKKYWIEPGTFAAYSIHDGISESILSKSGLIDGEYLDSVSETIGNEFDSLLRLEYDSTKAS
ncbi:MAG: AAA family ATPase [Terracidiphilus sp.]|jgi:hypothetical protein